MDEEWYREQLSKRDQQTNREVTIGSRPVPTATSNDREEVRN